MAWKNEEELLIQFERDIQLLNIRNGKRKRFAGPEQGLKRCMSLDVDRAGERVWVGSQQALLQCFDFEGTLLHDIPLGADWARCLRVSPNGKWVAATVEQQGVCVFDARTLAHVTTFPGDFSQLAFSADSALLSATRNHKDLPILQPVWNTKDWSLHLELPLPRPHGDLPDFSCLDDPRACCFHPDLPLLAVSQGFGEFSTSVQIWDLETQTCLRSFSDAHECVDALLFHPAGKELLATGTHNRGAALYRCPLPE